MVYTVCDFLLFISQCFLFLRDLKPITALKSHNFRLMITEIKNWFEPRYFLTGEFFIELLLSSF